MNKNRIFVWSIIILIFLIEWKISYQIDQKYEQSKFAIIFWILILSQGFIGGLIKNFRNRFKFILIVNLIIIAIQLLMLFFSSVYNYFV